MSGSSRRLPRREAYRRQRGQRTQSKHKRDEPVENPRLLFHDVSLFLLVFSKYYLNLLYMGNALFAKGLQKKMEKTGEDFLHSSISMRFIFYGMVWITQNPVGVDAHIDPAGCTGFYENPQRIRDFHTGRCGHRPLQRNRKLCADSP